MRRQVARIAGAGGRLPTERLDPHAEPEPDAGRAALELGPVEDRVRLGARPSLVQQFVLLFALGGPPDPGAGHEVLAHEAGVAAGWFGERRVRRGGAPGVARRTAAAVTDRAIRERRRRPAHHVRHVGLARRGARVGHDAHHPREVLAPRDQRAHGVVAGRLAVRRDPGVGLRRIGDHDGGVARPAPSAPAAAPVGRRALVHRRVELLGNRRPGFGLPVDDQRDRRGGPRQPHQVRRVPQGLGGQAVRGSVHRIGQPLERRRGSAHLVGRAGGRGVRPAGGGQTGQEGNGRRRGGPVFAPHTAQMWGTSRTRQVEPEIGFDS